MDTAGFILIPRYFCFGSIRRPVRKAAFHAYGLFGAFHIGLRKFVRCRSEAQNLCTSLNGRCPSGVRLWPTLSGCLYLVGVNVAIYSTGDGKGTENIKRAYGLNGIFSVPVFDLWRH